MHWGVKQRYSIGTMGATEPRPTGPESEVIEDLELIVLSFKRWHESCQPNVSGRIIRTADFRYAAEELEKLIRDGDRSIVLTAGEQKIPTYRIGRTYSDSFDAMPHDVLEPGEQLSLGIVTSVPNLTGSRPTRQIYAGDTYMRMVEMGEMADAIANGAELEYEKSAEEINSSTGS